VKCEDGNPTAPLQTEGQILQERVESAEFVVHGDSKGLENAAHGILVTSGAANDRRQLRGRRDASVFDGASQAIRLGFIGILEQQRGKRSFVKSR
jgi:hypothetical protein